MNNTELGDGWSCFERNRSLILVHQKTPDWEVAIAGTEFVYYDPEEQPPESVVLKFFSIWLTWRNREISVKNM